MSVVLAQYKDYEIIAIEKGGIDKSGGGRVIFWGKIIILDYIYLLNYRYKFIIQKISLTLLR